MSVMSRIHRPFGATPVELQCPAARVASLATNFMRAFEKCVEKQAVRTLHMHGM
jgi:hypothetical protein